MSNYLAIATVTAALQQILQPPLQNAVTGASVGFSRPDGKVAPQKGPRADVYLYRVTPNAAYRNVDLPTRRADGTLVKRPLTALDLHYLITFRGNDEKFEPQRMLGVVASTLDAQPLLSPQNIQNAMGFYTYLQGSGLDTQVDRVRFTPTALTLEEFTKLWSAFFQVEYSLSIAYQASVVLIESDETPQEALPVQARNIYVLPFQQPVITQVSAQLGGPIVPTSTLVIQGSHLLSDVTLVQIGDLVVAPAKVTNTQITLPVPAGLPAGVQGVQVVQQLEMGTPAQLHPGFDSNVAAMVLHPTISVDPSKVTTTLIPVNIVPAVQPGQRATLLLNEATLPPPSPTAAYSFTLPPPTVSTSLLNFAITGIPAGSTEYFIRVAIDGAESLLGLDPKGSNYGPLVTIT
jgi:hypothetical protein